jgi:hypothetical protein
MSKTPEEYRELFSQIEKKMDSTSPDDLALVVTQEFKEVVEALASEVQAIAPGMEGMMDFAKANAFDLSGVVGIWMAVGIAAATQGPRQKDWISQAGRLIKNLGGERGFSPMIHALTDAFNITSGGDRNDVRFVIPLDVDGEVYDLSKINIVEIISQIKEIPELSKPIRDIAMAATIEPDSKKQSQDEGFGL